MDQIGKTFHSVLFEGDRLNIIGSLQSQFSSYNRNYSRNILKYLKMLIKNKTIVPTVKLQALKLLNSLMESKNPHILEYCAKKFYNRFKIFAEFKKESQDERRGKTLFQAEALNEQKASEEFLILLHSSIKLWAHAYPIDYKGKVSGYKKLFDYLKTRGVTLIDIKSKKEKEDLRKALKDIRKSIKLMMSAIKGKKDLEIVKRVGKSIKTYREMLENKSGKFMEMEDHDLFKEHCEALKMVKNGQEAYASWKAENKRISILDSPSFVLPNFSLFLPDVSPKLLPEPDPLSESIQDISLPDSFFETLQHDKEPEYDKDLVSIEWKGLGADYCRLKDQLSLTERNMSSYQHELQVVTSLYDEERARSEILINQKKMLNEAVVLKEQDVLILSENLSKTASELRDTREYCRSLEETIKNLEVELKNLKKNFESKQNSFFKIEKSHQILEALCKSYENKLENSRETEKLLRKEIKELKTKEKVEDYPFDNLEDRVRKSIRFSIIQPLEPVQLVEKAQSSSFEDEDFKLLTAGKFVSSRKPPDKSLIISNSKNLKHLLNRRKGILYEDSLIEVSLSLKITSSQGICKVSIKNKSSFCLNCLNTKLFSDPSSGLTIKINTEAKESLQQGSETQRVLKFESNSVFTGFPSLKLSFLVQDQKKQVFLMLPVTYTLFCLRDPIDFIEEWEAIDESVDYSTNTHFSSIKKLTRSVLFSKSLLHAYIEGNGVIIGSRSPAGVVLAVCILSEPNVSISVKSKNAKLRDLLTSLLKMILEP